MENKSKPYAGSLRERKQHIQAKTYTHSQTPPQNTFTFTLARCVGIACTYIHHDSWTDGGPAHTHINTGRHASNTHSESTCSIRMYIVNPVQAQLNRSNPVTTCTTKRPLDTHDCNTRI